MTTITKRQQARNERALQDMTKNVPGNDRCADCATKNPTWASWNLGVFLCMRCAALHRKLGTHVSKVKSLSMDSWSTEQVENMRKLGNANSNRQLNPQNAMPSIPVDVDEVDAAIEKYIRLKYEQRVFVAGARSAPNTRQNTGSTGTGSFGDEPPPLPPKPGKHWGFNLRSTSSTLPKSKTAPMEHRILSGMTVDEKLSKSSKTGHLFGMRVTSVGNNFDQKLNMLQEMGFTDTKQNMDILKNANGSIDQAVEILTRLGEGTRPTPQTTSVRFETPIRTNSNGNGLTITKSRQKAVDLDNNPWEIRGTQRSIPAPLPQAPARSQSTDPVNNSWNPFLQPDSAQAVAGAFENLQLSQSHQQQATQSQQQQGFHPAHAALPAQQQPLSLQTTGNPWGIYMQPQHAMSVPAIPQTYGQASPLQPQHTTSVSGTPTFAYQAQPGYISNPFMQSASPQSMTSSNPWSQQMTPQTATPATPHSNPFGLPWAETKQSSATPMQQITMTQQMQQNLPPASDGRPQAFSNSPFDVTTSVQPLPAANLPSSNPFQQQASPIAAHQQQQQMTAFPQQMQQPQSMGYQQQNERAHILGLNQDAQQSQMTGYFQQVGQSHMTGYQAVPQPARHDKSSIMALYSQSQMMPHTPLQTLPEDSVSPQVSQIPQQQAPFSVGSMNPFVQQQQTSITAHASKESIDLQAFAQNGRQSPDAFAGLSSRYMR